MTIEELLKAVNNAGFTLATFESFLKNSALVTEKMVLENAITAKRAEQSALYEAKETEIQTLLSQKAALDVAAVGVVKEVAEPIIISK